MIRHAKSSDTARRGGPTVWVRLAASFVRRAELSGLDRDRMLAAARITDRELADPDGRLSLVALYDLLEAIVDLSGDRLALVRITRDLDLDAFEALAFIVMSSPTLRAGLRAMSKYQRLLSDGERYDVEEQHEWAVLAYMPWGRPRPAHALMAEMFITDVIVNGARLVGASFTDPYVQFAHPAPPDPAARRELSTILGVVPEFGQARAEVRIRTVDLDRAVASDRQSAVYAFFERHLEERVRALAPAGVAGAVRDALMRSSKRVPDVPSLARRLHMAARTLQRRLNDEGTSVRALLDETRRARALPLLASGRSIAEIAFMLGYTETSAFHRAFRRWTAQTPEVFRAAEREGRGRAPAGGGEQAARGKT